MTIFQNEGDTKTIGGQKLRPNLDSLGPNVWVTFSCRT